MARHTLAVVGAVVGLCASIALAAAPTTREVRTGRYDLTFTQRSPLSAPSKILARIGWSLANMQAQGAETDYRLENERFLAYVPAKYRGDEAYGLIVWVSPGDPPLVRPEWYALFDKHRFICIAAHRSGNERSAVVRIGLALDAAHNCKAIYNIDPKRVYVAGLSGGGRISSMTAICFPDVFCGGYYIIGCNYYRSVPMPGDLTKIYPRSFSSPPGNLLGMAKNQSRHVLLTGDADMNQPQTKANYEAMKSDRYRYVTYIQVPGMGHMPPVGEWFEKGLLALDAGGGPATRPASGR